MRTRRSLLVGLAGVLTLAGCSEEGGDSDADFSGEVSSGQMGDEGASHEVDLDEGETIRIVLDGPSWWEVHGPSGDIVGYGDDQEVNTGPERAEIAEEGDVRFTADQSGTYTLLISAKASSIAEYSIYLPDEE
jgi:hypothetical protein